MIGEIPIADPEVGTEEIAAVVDVLESGQLADGPEVRAFETAFAEACEVEHAVATSNGTTALHAALEAIDIEPGNRVVTTPFSFVATANAIRLAGGIPVFADIDPESFNLDPDSVEALLRSGEESVDAILAVHLYGRPAPMDHLGDLADEYDVPLVEDAAQAHGASYDGKPVGSIGDVASFSFYPTKNMTTGEGGMITTDDESIADAAARFVNHGREADGYEHVELGQNYRMTSMAAALGQVQLDRLPAFIERRRENANRLSAALADSPCRTPSEGPNGTHAYHQYTIRCGNRDAVRRELSTHGIGSGVYYPTCIHEQPAFEWVPDSAPVAERVADEVLSLPVHPNVSEEALERIGYVLSDEVEVVHV